MIDTKSILEMFDDCDFNNFSAENEYGVADYISDEYNTGASKLVFIPEDKDYVIKVPFCGYYDDAYDEDEAEEMGANEFGQFFQPFQMPWNQKQWDYCQHEVYLYHEAKANKVSCCFLKTTFIGKAQNFYPIYIQQKADDFFSKHEYDNEDDKQSYTKERKTPMQRCYNSVHVKYRSIDNEIWLTDAYEYYGPEVFSRLIMFLDKYQIDDLHSGNLGYINDRPVIIDYAGFYG